MAEEVRTQVPGNIWKVMAKEGDIVSEGDLPFHHGEMKTEVSHHCETSVVASAVNIPAG
jgi:biotin carboxyl carrier protein